MGQRMADWLEAHGVTPSYSGWLLGGLSIFFFMAATNTLAGWLYVISGTGLALLAIAALLPDRMLRRITVRRSAIAPVSVGDALTIELWLDNPTAHPKTLLQIRDLLPYVLANPALTAIETIPAGGSYGWVYYQPVHRRGIYHWHTVQLRTAAPLGLFWCRRERIAKATAVVYPTVLPLSQCPLVDEMGRDTRLQLNSDRRTQTATEGLTRSLRPYRWGDPTRLVHWRTSARYGELRVRELEIFTGGQELVICLDSQGTWRSPGEAIAESPQAFEQAVIAAASLYFYARRQRLNVQLWSPGTGLIQNSPAVLEALAAASAGESLVNDLPTLPLVWLTCNPLSLAGLPPGSRWILWTCELSGNTWEVDARSALLDRNSPGIVVREGRSLEQHLQSPLIAL